MKRRIIHMAERKTLDLGQLGEQDCIVNFHYKKGTPESGRCGLPENYDPGSDSELWISAIILNEVDLVPLFAPVKLNELIEQLKIELDEIDELDE